MMRCGGVGLIKSLKLVPQVWNSFTDLTELYVVPPLSMQTYKCDVNSSCRLHPATPLPPAFSQYSQSVANSWGLPPLWPTM